MERLTKKELTESGDVLCNIQSGPCNENPDCNDSCLYGICGWGKKALCKLKEYEDAEEQGLLLRLPCKVGDTIYRINQYAKEPIISMKVLQIRFGELYAGNSFLRIDAINDEDMGEFCYFKRDIGKTIFLTKEEAEQALMKKERKNVQMQRL